MELDQIVSWLNKTYPTRNWDQQCQRLVWNVIYCVMGYTRDSQMTTYATAAAARNASKIESTDALAAPAGAIHYWRNPAEGHVAIELGGGRVLMTGTPAALGAGGVQLGKNYGTTTVAAYSNARGNPYVGWARTNGSNASIVGKITTDAERTSWEASDFGIGTNATKAQWLIIQDWLTRLKRYDGLIDGIPGRKTWRGIQLTVAKYKYYHGDIDGIPGPNTAKGMQMYARDGGGYRGEVDGILGPNSWKGFVARLSS